MVAMNVNDLIVQGAKPLIFLDYISVNKIKTTKLKSIIKGIVKGCKISQCELVGGETAEMPGTYEKDKFDKKIINDSCFFTLALSFLPSLAPTIGSSPVYAERVVFP